jgi:hypothetical protein
MNLCLTGVTFAKIREKNIIISAIISDKIYFKIPAVAIEK